MSVLLVQGTARQIPLADASVNCVVTSPPYYGLRDYGIGAEQGELGGEPLHDCLAWARQEPPCAPPQCWVCGMRVVFAEVHRVMRPEATLWCNVGDSYASGEIGRHDALLAVNGNAGITYSGMGHAQGTRQQRQVRTGLKPKNLLGMPWRLALALQADGFILRSELIWHKLNPMPESVQDRPTRAHEQVFLFSKQATYWYDAEAVREPGSPNTQARFGNGGAPRQHGSKWAESHGGSKVNGWGLAQVEGRACRSVWSLASEPLSLSHFAAFPTALVRRCLLAGCPRQVCSACGKPHVRQVERQRMLDGYLPVTGTFAKPDEPFRIPPNGKGHYRYSTQTIDHGFAATCPCTALTRPGLVFDPFCGSGTTLLVARELGLDAVGTDLSWAYLHEIARERLGLAALHRWTTGATPPPVTYGDLPLFAEESV